MGKRFSFPLGESLITSSSISASFPVSPGEFWKERSFEKREGRRNWSRCHICLIPSANTIHECQAETRPEAEPAKCSPNKGFLALLCLFFISSRPLSAPANPSAPAMSSSQLIPAGRLLLLRDPAMPHLHPHPKAPLIPRRPRIPS